MFNIFKSSEMISLTDPDFGLITFVPSDSDPSIGIWQMNDIWEMPEDCARVGCSSIPGTTSDPYESAREFLLSKKSSLQEVWNLVAERLETIRGKWRPDTGQQDLRQVFLLTSLSLDEPMTNLSNWEVSFEPVDGNWILASIQLSGNIITGDTVDT